MSTSSVKVKKDGRNGSTSISVGMEVNVISNLSASNITATRDGQMEKPFLGVLSDLRGKGVEVRLIHAKEPGPNFREDFDRYPRMATMLV